MEAFLPLQGGRYGKRCTPEFKMGLLTMGIVVNLATGKDENLRKKKKKKEKEKPK